MLLNYTEDQARFLATAFKVVNELAKQATKVNMPYFRTIFLCTAGILRTNEVVANNFAAMCTGFVQEVYKKINIKPSSPSGPELN